MNPIVHGTGYAINYCFGHCRRVLRVVRICIRRREYNFSFGHLRDPCRARHSLGHTFARTSYLARQRSWLRDPLVSSCEIVASAGISLGVKQCSKRCSAACGTERREVAPGCLNARNSEGSSSISPALSAWLVADLLMLGDMEWILQITDSGNGQASRFHCL